MTSSKYLFLFISLTTVIGNALSSNFTLDKKDGIGLVIGGFNGGTTEEVFTHKYRCLGVDSDPMILSAPSGSLFGWFAEYVDERLYLCGGSDLKVHAECFAYNFQTTQWDLSCRMNEPRKDPATVIFNGDLYVLGGFNNEVNWMDSIERKAKGSCSWSRTNLKLKKPMKNSCAIQVDDKHIMTIGGSIHNFITPDIADVDLINMETGEITPLESLQVPRSEHGCVHYNHNGEEGVLVAGGCNDQCAEHLKSVVFFGFTSRKWVQMPDLKTGRNGHGMTSIVGYPTVVGGYNRRILGSSEYFKDGKWTQVDKALIYPRWRFGIPKYMPPIVTCPKEVRKMW